MNVEIINQPALRTATVHHAGPYSRISEAFEKLGRIAGSAGLLGPDTTMIGIYHDDPQVTPEEKLRSDAAVVIPHGARVPDGLGETVIPAGRYARTTHTGPYEKLPDAWARLMGEWLPRSGHHVGNGASYELYRNNPTNTRPQDLITEMYVPLK